MKTNVASFIVKDVKIITENTTVSVGSQLSNNNSKNGSASTDTNGTTQNEDNNTNTSSDANNTNNTTDNSTSGNSNQ